MSPPSFTPYGSMSFNDPLIISIFSQKKDCWSLCVQYLTVQVCITVMYSCTVSSRTLVTLNQPQHQCVWKAAKLHSRTFTHRTFTIITSDFLQSSQISWAFPGFPLVSCPHTWAWLAEKNILRKWQGPVTHICPLNMVSAARLGHILVMNW